LSFCVALLVIPLLTASASNLTEARVSQVIRDVRILPEHAPSHPAKISDTVRDGSAVRTGTESRAELTFTDQTLARLGANTIFTFNEGTRDLELGGGAMLLRVPKNAGGAKITTAAVTAAITGTTIMLEYHSDAFIKFIVLEGTGRIFRNDRLGESVLVRPGQMLIVNPRGTTLPDPVDVDLARLKKTSALLSKDFKPVASEDLISHEIKVQEQEKADQALLDTNLVIFGGGTAITLSDTIDQRAAVINTMAVRGGEREPIPPPAPSPTATPSSTPAPTPSPTVTPRPTVTPSPTVTPRPTVTPSATIIPTPSATPSPSATPTPTVSPTATPSATPGLISASYNGGTGNWSNPGSWTPGLVPNNTKNGVDFDVFFASGTLTQDIVNGVTINQLFMSGGTLVLANPLTLEAGLQFSGGSITSGILNIAGTSSQSALLTVGNTTINNSGTYDLVLNGRAFDGEGSIFNNSGVLTGHATDGKVTFNIPLNNTGTVSAEAGIFALTGGGTFSGTASAATGATLQFGNNFTISDGAQFIGAGTVQFNKPAITTLAGTITNDTHLVLKSSSSFADFVLNGNVTFTGSGVLSLVNADRIRGTGIFTNAGNTIEGETNNLGSFGNDEIGIVNAAGSVIDANIAGLTLNIDPNLSAGLTNEGVMEASKGGILLLSGNGGGAFTNSGTIMASGGALQFGGTVTSSGTVDVGGDTLAVSGSYTQSAGTFRLAGGSVTSTPALDFEGGLVDAWGTINGAIMNNAILQPALGDTGLIANGKLTLLFSSQLTFQLGGLTQGSEYSYLNINGTVALGGQLVLTFAKGFQHSVTNEDDFTVLTAAGIGLSGHFTNVEPGGRLETSDGFGSFQVDYNATRILLSNFIPSGGAFLDFDGLSSTTGAGGTGRSLSFSAPVILFGNGPGDYYGASFNGGNAAPGSTFCGGDGGSFAATATSGDVVVSRDIEASSGANGKDVISGKGGSVTLTSNSGQVAINNRVQVSHNMPGRRSSAGGSITLRSGKTSGVAINIANTGQLLSMLDAAAPGPGGKIVIQAIASTGNSQVNISGKVYADRGRVDIRNSASNGQVNLTNADMRADTLKAAALGSNGVLQIGGGSLTADTTLQLYASNGNGQVVFIGNVSLNGNSTKSIAGDSVTINNGVVVTVNGPKASVYVNSQNNIPKANYSGFGGNGHTTGTFGGSGANPPQPLGNAPALGLPPGG
jgi:mannose-6-phosphate isomerase-like protein (cupin superfamily)